MFILYITSRYSHFNILFSKPCQRQYELLPSLVFFIPISFLQASSSFIIIKIIITFLEQTIKLKYFHGYLSFSTIKFLLYFSFNFNVMEATSWEIYIYFCINKALLSDFVLISGWRTKS